MYTVREEIINSNFDNLPISLLEYIAEDEKGVVQFSHGMAEHKERYIPFMEFLAENGYSSYINDHRGHGKSVLSDDDLGYFYNNGADALLSDLKQINSVIRERHNTPLFLFGHSMGSLAVRAYTRLYDDTIDGLVVCGEPSNNPATGVAVFLCKLTKLFRGERHRSSFLNNLAFGAYNKNFKEGTSPFRWLSTNEENVKNYEADKYCGFVFTINGFLSLFGLMKQCYAKKGWKMSNPSLPVLFISGEDDPCRINDKAFLSAVDFMGEKYSNTRYILYPGLRHEILNETGNEKVFANVLDYLNEWRSNL